MGRDTGLVHEDCVAKMRLITLVDLGAHKSGQIPYHAIKETLQVILVSIMFLCPFSFTWLHLMLSENVLCLSQIEDSEVEPWVVKAITAKLLDCRIDQINEVVIVKYDLIPAWYLSKSLLWTIYGTDHSTFYFDAAVARSVFLEFMNGNHFDRSLHFGGYWIINWSPARYNVFYTVSAFYYSSYTNFTK